MHHVDQKNKTVFFFFLTLRERTWSYAKRARIFLPPLVGIYFFILQTHNTVTNGINVKYACIILNIYKSLKPLWFREVFFCIVLLNMKCWFFVRVCVCVCVCVLGGGKQKIIAVEKNVQMMRTVTFPADAGPPLRSAVIISTIVWA